MRTNRTLQLRSPHRAWIGALVALGLWSAAPVLSVLALTAPAFAQDAGNDDDDDGDDGGGGGGGGGGGAAAPAPDLSGETRGDNLGPDDECFEEAMLLPPWLRRCGEPREFPRPANAAPPPAPRGFVSPGSGVRSREAAAAPSAVALGVPLRPEPPNAIPREIVVTRINASQLQALEARGFTILGRATLTGREVLRLRAPGDLSTAEALALARQIAPNAIADYNHIYRPAQAACDTAVCRQRRAIRWPEPPAECRVETTIAMIDTSVDASIPALAGQRVEVASGVSGGRALASATHGTAIAALLAGRSDAAVPGLLPRGRLVAIQAFHRSAAGEDIADSFDIVAAIDAVDRSGVKVLNLSFTGPNNKLLADAVRISTSGGTAIVAAAGNLGPAGPVVYPAGYESVIAVTAIGDDLRIYRGANRGNFIDFAAPGVDVQVVAAKVATRFETGTSFAAPFLSAALAVTRAKAAAGASIADSVAALQVKATDLGRPGRDPVFGWGLVQIPDVCR